MSKQFLFLLSLISSALLFYSCEEKQVLPEQAPSGRNFFPIEVGNTWQYEVVRVQWVFREADTAFLDYEWSILDTTTSAAGEKLYRMEQRTKPRNSTEWSDTVTTIVLEPSSDELLWIENNIVGLAMVFPIENQKEWDFNTYNSNGFNEITGLTDEKVYQYQNLGNNLSVLDTTFSNTVRVQGEITDNLIERDEFNAYYAENVGMIERFEENLLFTLDDSTSQNVLQEGTQTTWKLKSFTN